MRHPKTEMNPRTSTPSRYQHPLRHYAELYDRSLSSIKRYARARAPLDDPETMPYFLAIRKDTGLAGTRKAIGPVRAAGGYLQELRSASDKLGEVTLHILNIMRSPDASEAVRKAAASQINPLAEFCGHLHGEFERAGVNVDRDVFGDEDDEELAAAVGFEAA